MQECRQEALPAAALSPQASLTPTVGCWILKSRWGKADGNAARCHGGTPTPSQPRGPVPAHPGMGEPPLMEQFSHPTMEKWPCQGRAVTAGKGRGRSSPCQALREQMEDELGHAQSPRPFLTLQMVPAPEERLTRAWRALSPEEKLFILTPSPPDQQFTWRLGGGDCSDEAWAAQGSSHRAHLLSNYPRILE